MARKKRILLGIIVFMVVTLNIITLFYRREPKEEITLYLTISGSKEAIIEVFHSDKEYFLPEDGIRQNYNYINEVQTLVYQIDSNTKYLRFDFGDEFARWKIIEVWGVVSNDVSQQIDLTPINTTNSMQHIEQFENKNGVVTFNTRFGDPYIITECDLSSLNQSLAQKALIKDIILNIIIILVFDILVYVVIKKNVIINLIKIIRDCVFFLKEAWSERRLIFNLAKNDFKTRYAGSYLGIIWAFIQPVVTIMVYVLVFTLGFKSGTTQNVPFTLYLIGGMVPWLYFQEALGAGTGALVEYSYLVKKIVFKISILPVVKLVSAFFVHLCFVAFAIVVFIIYGYIPTLHIVQIVYYAFAMFIFTLAICYTTSAIVIFFRDLSQVIMIVLQVGVWSMPILWDINIAPMHLQWLFKINPMYYIVSGYRQSLYEGIWVWNRLWISIYFWSITVGLLLIGTTIFKRLKVHFADVL